jgi:phasin family protein
MATRKYGTRKYRTTVKYGATPAKAAAVAQQTRQAAVAATTKGFDQTVAALKDGVSGAVAGFEKTQAEVKANMEKAMKTAEEFISFGQGNVEAVLKSGQIWAEGVQEFGKTFAATAQAQLDHTMNTWKALTGVKSLKEAIDLQADLARNSVETVVAETGKLTDASMKLAEQALAPITARVTLAVEKFGRAA